MRPTVGEILADHVSLEVACLDRLYVNGYVPTLQTSGQLVHFLGAHLGNPLASPALLGQIGDRFRREVERFVEQEGIPVVRFERGQRKDDVAAGWRQRFRGEEGVVFVGVAQERCRSFRAKRVETPAGGVSFDFSRQWVFVNHYYFYVQDREWGPAFLKVGTYMPYPVKLCLNGHEWVKQHLRREGIDFESLDNGFVFCAQPGRLQDLCDQLGPGDIQAFFDRWSSRLPLPLSADDRAAGYRHQLSLWQVEVSLTQVFNRPLDGRHFFDQVIRANLDLGRPDRIRLLFPRRLTRRTPPPAYGYRTRVITSEVDPSLHIDYKHSHVKQYFKQGRALRTETTINDPADFGLRKGLPNLWQLKSLGHTVNRQLLEAERLADDGGLDGGLLEQLQRPTTCDQGHRVAAFRFGDSRVMALLAALGRYSLQLDGFRNRDLRRLVEPLLGNAYTSNQMTYDLRRLRRRGLISRIAGSHRYLVTPLGLRVAYLYTRLFSRLLKPAWRTLLPTPLVPSPLQRALRTLDRHLEQVLENQRLPQAA
jgi:hypothetical protein